MIIIARYVTGLARGCSYSAFPTELGRPLLGNWPTVARDLVSDKTLVLSRCLFIAPLLV